MSNTQPSAQFFVAHEYINEQKNKIIKNKNKILMP